MSTTREEPEQEETRAGLAPSIQTNAVDERKPQQTAKSMTRRKPRQSRRTRGFRGIFQSTRSALQALRANALRSLLTSLGIIIGVGAVVIMIAISEGNTAAINQRLSTLNPLQLTIRSGSTSTGGVRGGAGTLQSLTQADADALAQLQGVTAVSPTLNANGQVVFSNQNWSTSVQGVYPSYQQIGSWQMQEGSFFTQSDQQSGTNVAVLGQTVVDNLFTPLGIDPIGQQIRISNQTFTIVGTLASKGSTGFGANADDVVYVPFSTAQQRLSGSQFVNSVVLTADNTGDVNSVQSAAQALLEQRHNISNPANDNFTIQNASQVLSTVQATAMSLTILLVGVAAVSLLVGGIGIMNIMLVSVTERTREIGIRIAIGARQRDVLAQFLIEAFVLSALGGIIGLVIGPIVAFAIANSNGYPLVIDPLSILLAFGVSALIGIVFGFYPAQRAARLDPIVALRTE
ncbi:MAG TPA: ABC transporter permease [Ktedonobacteraceae bacterium]|nr:ABC transporter permease [Ktedonobacteraceae bacterium]